MMVNARHNLSYYAPVLFWYSLIILLMVVSRSVNASTPVSSIELGTMTGINVGPFVLDVVTDDINHDGYPDILTTSGTELKIFLGNGFGQFSFIGSFSVPYSKRMATGDFNGDGIVDLAIGQSTQYKASGSPNQVCGRWAGVMIYLGVSNTKPQYRYKTCLVVNKDTPAQPVVGDFNEDGILDLLTVRADGVARYLGKGDGSFSARKLVIRSTTKGEAIVADVNHDGKLDILLNENFVYYGNGNSEFKVSDIRLGNMTTIGDVDGDGLKDIITDVSACCPLASRIRVYSHFVDGRAQYVDKRVVAEIDDLVVADFNHDSIDDVLIRFEYEDDLAIFAGEKYGELAEGQYFASVEYDERDWSPNILVGDWNIDGLIDLGLFGYFVGEGDQLWMLTQNPLSVKTNETVAVKMLPK